MGVNSVSGRLMIVSFLLAVVVFFPGCRDKPQAAKALAVNSSQSRTPDKTVNNKTDPVKLSVSFTGDIMIHSDELLSAYDNKSGRYSFDSFFSEIKPYLSKPDIMVGNLETTVSGSERGFSGYPQFNSPEEILTALDQAGFDVLTTANNHAMDRRQSGVLQTITNLDRAGFAHTGTFSSASAREKQLIVEVRGFKIGIIAFTYGTNGIPLPKDRPYLVNTVDLAKIRQDIKSARADGANLVVVCPHIGVEYQRTPGEKEKDLVDALFRAGADVVMASHPHVLQPMVRNELLPQAQGLFAAYSLGNFVSAQRGQYKDSGVILNLTLEKDPGSGQVRLTDVSYIPTWVQRYRLAGKPIYRVLAVEKAIRDYQTGKDKKLTAADYARLKQVWRETTTLLSGPYSPRILHV